MYEPIPDSYLVYRPSVKELAEYDTIDKIVVLAKSLDVSLWPLDIIGQIAELVKRQYDKEAAEREIKLAELVALGNMQDLCWQEILVRREKRNLEKLISAGSRKIEKKFFLTINFPTKLVQKNEREFLLDMIQRLGEIANLNLMNVTPEKYIEKDNAVAIHYHIHAEVETTYAKSQLIVNVASKFKKFISKNFIDVKPYKDIRHDKYLEGCKKDSKMKYVEMDRQWRESIGI